MEASSTEGTEGGPTPGRGHTAEERERKSTLIDCGRERETRAAHTSPEGREREREGAGKKEVLRLGGFGGGDRGRIFEIFSSLERI